MIFDPPLLRGTLIRRYQRFLADVRLDSGESVTAHCPNSGSMLSVHRPGAEVWVSPALNPARRLRHTWELVVIDGTLIGINTARPNRLVAEAIAAGAIPELLGYDVVRREVRYGRNSRIDLLLEGPDRPPCYVEIKNVTMRRGGNADAPVEFPDSVTERGTKHLRDLTDVVRGGARAMTVYLAQRGDGARFAIAEDIDPVYAAAFDTAVAGGVEMVCYRCEVTAAEVRVSDRLPILTRHRREPQAEPSRGTLPQHGVA